MQENRLLGNRLLKPALTVRSCLKSPFSLTPPPESPRENGWSASLRDQFLSPKTEPGVRGINSLRRTNESVHVRGWGLICLGRSVFTPKRLEIVTLPATVSSPVGTHGGVHAAVRQRWPLIGSSPRKRRATKAQASRPGLGGGHTPRRPDRPRSMRVDAMVDARPPGLSW